MGIFLHIFSPSVLEVLPFSFYLNISFGVKGIVFSGPNFDSTVKPIVLISSKQTPLTHQTRGWYFQII